MIDDPNEKDLLRCIVKKTASLLGTHILWASYVIVGILATVLVYFGIIAIWQAVGERAYEVIVGTMFSVPWWAYVIIGIFGSYLGYSALWCIARNLTAEDWESKEAKRISENIAIAFFALALFALAPQSKAFLFIGAYQHYRKRMREKKMSN